MKTLALESYLAAELGIDVDEVDVLADGLNLILGISTEDDEKYVVRRETKLRDASYMTDVETEYKVMRRLADTPIPMPRPLAFCDDKSVLGGPFFVMSALDGETVSLGSDLPERFRNPRSRERIAHQLIDTLADVHSQAVEPFADVCERRTAREQVENAVERLDAATSVTEHDVPKLQSAGEWLLRNAPSHSKTTLIHGDFRPGNVLFSNSNRPEITGVLDWESAKLGDPLTELGYLLLRWRDEGDPTLSLDELEAKYPNHDSIRELREDNENGLAPFTAKPGSPTRRELVARYEERTGFSFKHERFYRAHAAFLLAVVWEDLHRHDVESGTEPEEDPYIEYMGIVANSIIDGEFEL
ncbi:aminoglycoside phosphotransferase [Haladaptatus sp. R4]|uniref:phosphotransferase family protein n=1 Tax=Haladaptatus sp. R4 TaxID=1679489 RepID=UPI0007B49B02|nr:phosphotransferase family protein [Haladaptatus sp. R4]KZN22495.1 aminoglycoside phosphotransferase [Haladaptatus sp. R4]